MKTGRGWSREQCKSARRDNAPAPELRKEERTEEPQRARELGADRVGAARALGKVGAKRDENVHDGALLAEVAREVAHLFSRGEEEEERAREWG